MLLVLQDLQNHWELDNGRLQGNIMEIVRLIELPLDMVLGMKTVCIEPGSSSKSP